MLRDEEPADPLTVYLNLKADDARTEARKASVTTYLASTGLKPEQIALELGRNPDATGSAQAGLTNVKKTETGSGATAEGAMIIAPSIDPAAVTE